MVEETGKFLREEDEWMELEQEKEPKRKIEMEEKDNRLKGSFSVGGSSWSRKISRGTPLKRRFEEIDEENLEIEQL